MGKRRVVLKRVYVISEFHGNDYHAGPKAQRDIESILESNGVTKFKIGRPRARGVLGRFLNRLVWMIAIRFYRLIMPSNATIIMQYPSAAWSRSRALRLLSPAIIHSKKIKLITIIHDISSLRNAGENIKNCALTEEESSLFGLSDKVVVHNESMKQELITREMDPAKLVCLGCFDYIASEVNRNYIDAKLNDIVIAGNLMVDKCGYLASLKFISGIDWRLYGINFDPEKISGGNIHYKGSYSPESLPSQLNGAFGLVWDGMSIDTCNGSYGEYLRINNPHKLSLYLASGLPVIVWEKAAVAEFVKANGIGLVVGSLYELETKIQQLSHNSYIDMCNNVKILSSKVRAGSFIMRAIESVF